VRAFRLANLGHIVVLPAFDMETLTIVLQGMLVLGGLRSFEKVEGVSATGVRGRGIQNKL
jgi:hypothetical protein